MPSQYPCLSTFTYCYPSPSEMASFVPIYLFKLSRAVKIGHPNTSAYYNFTHFYTLLQWRWPPMRRFIAIDCQDLSERAIPIPLFYTLLHTFTFSQMETALHAPIYSHKFSRAVRMGHPNTLVYYTFTHFYSSPLEMAPFCADLLP